MDATEKPVLRKVEWVNIWQFSAALHSDGYGTKTHLTDANGATGKTLCGKEFPAFKGHPSSWGAGYCKRCLNKAYKMGFEKGFTKSMEWVGSVSG